MEIRIIVFGQLTDIIGKTELAFSDVNNTDELKQKLSNKFPELSKIKYAIAVNKIVAQKNTVLIEKDLVALLPPFSGG